MKEQRICVAYLTKQLKIYRFMVSQMFDNIKLILISDQLHIPCSGNVFMSKIAGSELVGKKRFGEWIDSAIKILTIGNLDGFSLANH